MVELIPEGRAEVTGAQMGTPRQRQGSTEFWSCPFSSDQKNLIAMGEQLRLQQLRMVQTTSMQTIQRLSTYRLRETSENPR